MSLGRWTLDFVPHTHSPIISYHGYSHLSLVSAIRVEYQDNIHDWLLGGTGIRIILSPSPPVTLLNYLTVIYDAHGCGKGTAAQ